MSDEHIFQIIEEIVELVTGNTNLTMDTDFIADLSLNSLDIANLVREFEERFDVRIPLRDIGKFSLVKDVVIYIQKNEVL